MRVTVIAIAFYAIPYFLAQRLRRCTTLGALSSERETLNRLSLILDLTDIIQEGEQCLSDDSREHLKEFGRILARYVPPLPSDPLDPDVDAPRRCFVLVDGLEKRCRSSWFLFWRSAKFRKDLAGASEEIRRFCGDVNVGTSPTIFARLTRHRSW